MPATSILLNDMEVPLLPEPPEAPRRWKVFVAAATMATVLASAFVLLILQGSSIQGVGLDGRVSSTRKVEADVGVVAADNGLCSEIGVSILKQGGNAIDSAIATAFCEGVSNPAASGIGGGDFMLVRMANGHAVAFDFRETAPLLSYESMYANNSNKKSVGGLAVAVPGQVKGLYLAWKKFGKLPWRALVEPAIRLARDGVRVTPYLASQIQDSLTAILASSSLRDVLAPNGVPLLAGDLLICKALGGTLTAIAEQGSDAFYSGPIAEALIADVRAAGGILSLQDLKEYRVKVSKPIVADTWGHTVLSFPPPSSGSGLILILNILKAYNDSEVFKGDLGLHRLVEALKHTYAVRSHLGDPAFNDMTGVVENILSPDFAASLQKILSDNITYGPERYGGKYNPLNQGNDHGTSHLSVVDRDRNAVALTSTVNNIFGAKILSYQTGVVLNNEMDDFSTPEDNPANGPPSIINFIEPKKKPLSTMSPTILLKDGQFRAVAGGSGGIKILTAVTQVLLNVMNGDDPLAAVLKPRIHHQLLPDQVDYENLTVVSGERIEVPKATREFLMSRGHILASSTSGGVCQLVVQDLTRPITGRRKAGKVFYGKLTGVSDLRKDGHPAGY